MTNLRELSLNHTRFTDKGIAALRPLEKLERLELFRTRAAATAIATIAGFVSSDQTTSAESRIEKPFNPDGIFIARDLVISKLA